MKWEYRICAISLTRLVYNTRETYMLTHFTEYAGIATILGGLEANLSIVCACLPTYPPLMTIIAEKLRTTFGSNDGSLRGLFNSFSLRNRKQTHDSVKLGSTTDRQANSATDDDLESARLQRHHDRLYPLSMSVPTRISQDEEVRWVDQTGKNHIRVDTDTPWSGPGVVEMERLGDRVEPHNNINITKSWGIS